MCAVCVVCFNNEILIGDSVTNRCGWDWAREVEYCNFRLKAGWHSASKIACWLFCSCIRGEFPAKQLYMSNVRVGRGVGANNRQHYQLRAPPRCTKKNSDMDVGTFETAATAGGGSYFGVLFSAA